MGKFIDLTGQKFGRLTVIKRAENDKSNRVQWLCQCECGNTKVIRGNDLKLGNIKSCGCLREDIPNGLKHGMKDTRLYRIWQAMKNRCRNKNTINYKHYGGKGVKVCKDWQDFMSFYEWAMAHGYNDTLSIDRINSNGNYEPSNCRWATQKMQVNNCSRNRILEFKGEKHTVSEWGEITGIGKNNISNRINQKGWSIEKALTQPIVDRQKAIKEGK